MAIPQVDVQALHCCQTPQEAVTGPELGGLVVVALVAGLWLTGQAAALQLSDCELPPEHSPLRDLERVPPPQLTLHVDHWPQAPQGTAQAFELQDSDSLKEVHPPEVTFGHSRQICHGNLKTNLKHIKTTRCGWMFMFLVGLVLIPV